MRLLAGFRVKVAIVTTIVSLLVFQVAPAWAVLYNAYNYRNVQNKGAYSAIVTGNPTLRDDPSGKWSYMRVAVQRIISGNVYYAEIGWLKGAQPESGQIPRAYWTYRATDGTVDKGWGGYPGIGIGYNYKVQWLSPVIWGFYFNDMNNPLAMRYVGWDMADVVFSGGEVPNLNQGMGYSGNNNVAYADAGFAWYALCGTTTRIDDARYHVDPGGNCNSWNVYGNN